MGKYDNCGNRITKETPFGKITYKYDSENRLIGSTSFGTENQKNLYIKNEYDKNGNLLKSISPQKEIYYTYNAENRIETVLIIDHVHKTKTEESYFYDSFGRRVKEIKNGIEVYYQYEGLSFNLLTETMYKVDFLEKGDFELDSELNLSFDSNYKNSYDFSSENLAYRYRYISDEVKPVSTKSYYYKDGNLVANADTRSSAYFFSDYQGSTRYVTDTEGFSESYNYDSFGKPIYNGDYVGYEEGYFEEELSKSDLETSGYETYKTTSWPTKREENPQSSLYQEYLSVAGYSGKSYNPETCLNNYGYRDYSPNQARFITVDPIRDGSNWYTLAVNNPVCFVDLWGLCTGDKKASVWDNYKGSGNPYEGVETEKLYNIIPYYISEKSQNRQQTKINIVKAIVIHWTGVPNQSPIDTIDYWNSDDRIGSAQYVVSTSGGIFQAMPEEERARHAGSSDGKYQPKATELFGDGINPNAYSIGIEMEPINWAGEFSEETFNAAVLLTSELCERYNLDPYSEVIRHYDVTGKECPKLYVNDEIAWRSFLDAVSEKMEENK